MKAIGLPDGLFEPAMRARRSGRVLSVSSILGRLTIPLAGAYAVSKWVLEAMAETMAFEVAHFGIAVTTDSGGGRAVPSGVGAGYSTTSSTGMLPRVALE
ncbi:SDR family NAD(P)-dependent oxidoreductase [Sphaerisporangium perillae]|uniref:SDR family NAD(P)-dependent oxidoreductase n=1 Tax=Sphaerisporangium perillae TaxID=2935860 RepID=UPI00200EA2F3|nr:SDR family NAD(P)-dependent oxidoreductase [Sphaerisporangium perillae]